MIPPRAPGGSGIRVDASERWSSRSLLVSGVPMACFATARARHDVLIEERRGDLQGAGNVVEAVADVVGGEQSRGVDINAEQVAHRVGIFGSIQAVNADAARIEVRGAGLIQGVL